MTPDQLRRRLLAGDTVFGTLIVSPSPQWPGAVRECGLDFVFIDTEHIALHRVQLRWMRRTYAAGGAAGAIPRRTTAGYHRLRVLPLKTGTFYFALTLSKRMLDNETGKRYYR